MQQRTENKSSHMSEDRDREMVRLRKSGQTLQSIANRYGLTRERVRQVIGQLDPNVTAKQVRKTNLRAAEIRQSELESNIRNAVKGDWDNFKSKSIDEIAKEIGKSQEVITRALPKLIVKILKGNEEVNLENYIKWTNEDCIAAITEASTFHYPLRMKEYMQLVATGVVDGPSVPLLFKKFGSWTAACEQAGISFVNALRDYDRVWSNKDLQNFVFEFAKIRMGELDSWDNFCNWLKEMGDGYPSPATMRNRLGGWREMRSEAYLRVLSEEGMDVVKW